MYYPSPQLMLRKLPASMKKDYSLLLAAETPNASPKELFDCAWWYLMGGDGRSNRHKCITYLYLVQNNFPDRKRECFYYLSLAYLELGEPYQALPFILQLYEEEPGNAHVAEVYEMILNAIDKLERRQTITQYTVLGLAVVGLVFLFKHNLTSRR